MEISLLDAITKEKVWSAQLNKANITDWMPGENWSVAEQRYLVKPPVYHIQAELLMEKNIPKGKYIIAMSVLDPAGLKPSLRFSNKNYFNGGLHPMGYVGLGEKLKKFTIEPAQFNDIQADTSLKYEVK